LALFSIGIIGVLTRRNAIIVFMCIELMLNAVNLLLVAFSKVHYGAAIAGNPATTAGVDGQLFVFFIMVVAAAEVSVGLARTKKKERKIRTNQKINNIAE